MIWPIQAALALCVLLGSWMTWTSAAAIPNGKYIRPREEATAESIVRQLIERTAHHHKGQYVPTTDQKYVHVPDKRERGKYVHIPFPYMGGYGPYDGLNGLPYEYDPAGDYSFEKFQTTQRATTRRPASPRPRRTYDDEGRWKIIRQNELKMPKNYEYVYETENGIYAQEAAVVGMKHSDTAGTRGEGFYQYIGDDDRIYRVEYTVGEQGYRPKLIIMDNPLSNRTTKTPRTTVPSWKRTSPPKLSSTYATTTRRSRPQASTAATTAKASVPTTTTRQTNPLPQITQELATTITIKPQTIETTEVIPTVTDESVSPIATKSNTNSESDQTITTTVNNFNDITITSSPAGTIEIDDTKSTPHLTLPAEENTTLQATSIVFSTTIKPKTESESTENADNSETEITTFATLPADEIQHNTSLTVNASESTDSPTNNVTYNIDERFDSASATDDSNHLE